jgi:hypothetical protein
MVTQSKEEHLKLVGEDEDFLAPYVTFALWAIAIIVCIATVTGLVESYNGLYIWFATHHITGIWADIAPLAVDTFTVMGELGIFVAISRKWDWKARFVPWGSAALGICSSVAANVGDKVQFHSIPTDLTAAVFPIAGALGLVMGLGILKRVAQDHSDKVALRKAASVTLSPERVAEQLMKDNQELLRKLEERPATVIDISPPEFSLTGMDVLIPPQPTTPNPVPIAEPGAVSREEARRRMSSSPQYGGRVISPEGLDVRTTGQWAAIPADA